MFPSLWLVMSSPYVDLSHTHSAHAIILAFGFAFGCSDQNLQHQSHAGGLTEGWEGCDDISHSALASPAGLAFGCSDENLQHQSHAGGLTEGWEGCDDISHSALASPAVLAFGC